MKEQRLGYLDGVKGISIILVVFSHVSNQIIIGKDPIAIWINSFDLPLFFIVSGFLISYKNEVNNGLKNIFKKKIRSILYPYIMFSCMYLIYIFLIRIFERNFDFIEIIKIIGNTLSLWGISTLWFLPTLFIAEIVFISMIKKVKKYVQPVILLLVLLCGILLSNNIVHGNDSYTILIRMCILLARSFFAVFFVGIGYYLNNFSKKNFYIKDKLLKLSLGIIVFSISSIFSLNNIAIDLRTAYIENITLYIFNGIFSSISILWIFEEVKLTRVFNYYGKNSLIIMATHLAFPIIIISKALTINILPFIEKNNYFYVVIVFSVVMIFEYIIINVVNRYMQFLIKYPKKLLKEHINSVS